MLGGSILNSLLADASRENVLVLVLRLRSGQLDQRLHVMRYDRRVICFRTGSISVMQLLLSVRYLHARRRYNLCVEYDHRIFCGVRDSTLPLGVLIRLHGRVHPDHLPFDGRFRSKGFVQRDVRPGRQVGREIPMQSLYSPLTRLALGVTHFLTNRSRTLGRFCRIRDGWLIVVYVLTRPRGQPIDCGGRVATVRGRLLVLLQMRSRAGYDFLSGNVLTLRSGRNDDHLCLAEALHLSAVSRTAEIGSPMRIIGHERVPVRFAVHIEILNLSGRRFTCGRRRSVRIELQLDLAGLLDRRLAVFLRVFDGR